MNLLIYAVNSKADDSKLPEMLSKRFPDLIPGLPLLAEAAAQHLCLPTVPTFQIIRNTLRMTWPEALQHGPCDMLMDQLCIAWLALRQADKAWEKDKENLVTRAAWEFTFTVHGVFLAAEGAKDQMRFCANKDCQTPYFVKTRRRQEYCSLQCAAEGTKEAKRKWWIREGRKRRRKATKRKRQPVAVRKTQKGR